MRTTWPSISNEIVFWRRSPRGRRIAAACLLLGIAYLLGMLGAHPYREPLTERALAYRGRAMLVYAAVPWLLAWMGSAIIVRAIWVRDRSERRRALAVQAAFLALGVLYWTLRVIAIWDTSPRLIYAFVPGPGGRDVIPENSGVATHVPLLARFMCPLWYLGPYVFRGWAFVWGTGWMMLVTVGCSRLGTWMHVNRGRRWAVLCEALKQRHLKWVLRFALAVLLVVVALRLYFPGRAYYVQWCARCGLTRTIRVQYWGPIVGRVRVLRQEETAFYQFLKRTEGPCKYHDWVNRDGSIHRPFFDRTVGFTGPGPPLLLSADQDVQWLTSRDAARARRFFREALRISAAGSGYPERANELYDMQQIVLFPENFAEWQRRWDLYEARYIAPTTTQGSP